MRLIRRGPGERKRGTVAVEMAIGMPLFLTLLLSMIEMTRLGQAYELLAFAASQGCRAAVIPGNSQANAETVVRTILSAGGITSYNTPQWIWGNGQTNLAGTHLGDAVTLTLSVPFSSISWLSRPLFLGSATLRATATYCSETPT